MEILCTVLGILWGISELLALIPSINSNSVFQMIVAFIKKAMEATCPPKSE